MTVSGFLVQLFNGLSGASLLFVVGAGRSLIFGVTRIVDFARTTRAALGACRRSIEALTRLGLLLSLVVASAWAHFERVVESVGSRGVTIPAIFEDDRIAIVAPSVDRPELRFYADSGGGFNAVDPRVVERLDLEEIGSLSGDDLEAPLRLVAFPAAMLRAGIPPSAVDGPFKGGLVVPSSRTALMFTSDGYDGFLGGRWFDAYAWEIDYGHHTVRLLQRVAPVDRTHTLSLGFQQALDGRRTTAFARLPVVVDGETLQMLFDTGARATLADGAAKAFGRSIGTNIGTSFITRSVFERWTKRHPEWRTIHDGDRLGDARFPMIEVSGLSIAGLDAGPVWFTQRRDDDFLQFMSSMMDAPIEGAIGGSALHSFRVTMDYPAAVAYFESSKP